MVPRAQPDDRDPEDLLPLKPDVFLILTILARGERYGYAILQEAEGMSAGRVRLHAGALYRRLKWMLEAGLIRELDRLPAEDEGDDERRRYYGVTPFGRRVADAEARRMGELLSAARRADLIRGPETG